jgi:hypothetical protein
MKIRIPHDKYLKILSSICMCNGKSIIRNQINVLNFFFKAIPKRLIFFFYYKNFFFFFIKNLKIEF